MTSNMADTSVPDPFSSIAHDDQDVCRVCRVEADEDEPLIHPCKCSGSVRFVHTGCLKSWLAASQKRFCEICGHKYTFTKVYPEYIPPIIPPTVYIRQALRFLYRLSCYFTRFWAAVFGWLIVLPSLNMFTLRSLIWLADTIAGAHPDSLTAASESSETAPVNVTSPLEPYHTINNASQPLRDIFDLALRSWYTAEDDTLPGFVFRGQILSIAVAGVLLGLVLVREWITQHDWTQNLNQETEELEEIVPEDWVIQRGIALKWEELWTDGDDDQSKDLRANADVVGAQSPNTQAIHATDPTDPSDKAPEPATPPGIRMRRQIESLRAEIAHYDQLDREEEELEKQRKGAVASGVENASSIPAYSASDSKGEDETSTKAGPSSEAGHIPVTNSRPAGPSQIDLAFTAPEMLRLREALRLSGAPELPNNDVDVRELMHEGETIQQFLGRIHERQPVETESLEQYLARRQGQEREEDYIDIDAIAPAAIGQARVRLPMPPPGRPRRHAAGPRIGGEEILPEDVEEVNLDREDWDGILEVIGLIGPWQNLFQNVLFAIIIMGATLTTLTGTPIIVGKAFLTFKFVETAIAFLRFCTRIARLVTDPVVDICVEILKDVILLPMFSSFRALENIAAKKLSLPHATAASDGRFSHALADLGSRIVILYDKQHVASVRLAASQTVIDRIWCMAVGYAVAISTVCLIAFAGEANLGRLSSGVVDQMRQHGKFLKLALFMALEMVMFPIVAGTAINYSLIPLFEGVTVATRIEQLRHTPFGLIFVNWIIGTSFMYGFSSLLSHIRSTLRPGTVFFIRDPSDESYSPVKDILERPTLSQLRKLSVSAVIYCFVIFSLFGAVSWSLKSVSSVIPVLPLKLDQKPLTSVPFDLLFLHLVVPPTIDAVRPKHKAKRLWTAYWGFAAHVFALSELMYGSSRRSIEEKRIGGPKVVEALWPILDPVFQAGFGRYSTTATDARVPFSDRVALLSPAERQKDGVFIPVDGRGAPKNKEGTLALLKQDRRARQKKRDPRGDYTIVWLPQYWRTRIHVFILCALGMASTLIAATFFGPILIGRAALAMVTTNRLHDGYCYVAGAYICLVAGYLGRNIGRRVTRSAYAKRLRRSDSSTRAKRVLITALVNVYRVVNLYFMIPVLVGFVFELYISIPARYGLNDAAVVVHFWDAWSVGTIVTSLLVAFTYTAARRISISKWYGGMAAVGVRECLRNPFKANFYDFNKTMLSAYATLAGFCLAPALLLMPYAYFSDPSQPEWLTNVIFRWSYPGCLAAACAAMFRHRLSQRVGVIRQRMIDAEYVVEERVENYDPSKEIAQPASAAAIDGVNDDDDGEWIDEVEDEDALEEHVL